MSGAGDVNGDGIDDLIVGVPDGDAGGNASADAGEDYSLVGHAGGGDVDLASLAAGDGFRLLGADAGDEAGRSVHAAGDLNGDGIGDLIVGAPMPMAARRPIWSRCYVVFGHAGASRADIDLESLAAGNGFRITGVAGGTRRALSVSAAGDVNGDGIDDVIVGAHGAAGDAGQQLCDLRPCRRHAAPTSTSRRSTADGFRLQGADAFDSSAFAVSGAGDVNGDGIDDLIVGAPPMAPATAGPMPARLCRLRQAGGFARRASISPALDGSDGFRHRRGRRAGDLIGVSVAWRRRRRQRRRHRRPDRRGLAAPAANCAGASYVVFGTDAGFAASLDLAALDGSDGFRLDGAADDSAASRSPLPATSTATASTTW